MIKRPSKTVGRDADYAGRPVIGKLSDETWAHHRFGSGVKIKF